VSPYCQWHFHVRKTDNLKHVGIYDYDRRRDDIDESQGSVATLLKCVWIFNYHFVIYFTVESAVKEVSTRITATAEDSATRCISKFVLCFIMGGSRNFF